MALLEHSTIAGYQENDADVHAVCELAENLRDTILEYQVSGDLEIPCLHC